LKDEIVLTIPASPEYVGVTRLVVAGLAARLKFKLEDSEDLKIAVDELCAYITGTKGREGTLEIRFGISEEDIAITGMGHLTSPEEVTTELSDFSRMILDTVTDSASLESLDGLPIFHVTKTRR
jgi:anti-sigma regulatory factor (Ser/Thr protein kinase)